MGKLTGERLARAMASRQFRDGKFHNTSGATAGLEGPSGGVIWDFVFGRRKRVPPAPIPIANPLETWKAAPSSGLRVTWLGHSMLLLEIDGVRVLTDPVWCERASPVQFAGPSSVRALGEPITATPAQHFSGRGLGDRNTTLWSSFVLSTPKHRVFFSADTGPTKELADIAARFGPFDLCMIEIGAWHPAWGSIHLGPQRALEAFEQLGGGTFLPIHWATFDLALHLWDEPAETLLALAGPGGRGSSRPCWVRRWNHRRSMVRTRGGGRSVGRGSHPEHQPW
jgi:hypothetical protein